MKLTTQERCPFCNCDEVSPGEWPHPDGHDLVAMCCEGCGARGPFARVLDGHEDQSYYFAEALFGVRRGVRGGNGEPYHWEVISTCLGTGELMVTCTKTGSFGVIPDPTSEEWARAFYSPSTPYPWPPPSRVVVKREGSAA